MSAVVGVALACAAGVAAWSLTSSYDDLVAHPARYGSAWDAQVGNVGSLAQQETTRANLAAIPGITGGTSLSLGYTRFATGTAAGELWIDDVAVNDKQIGCQ